jgi:hypothetical protein
MENYCTFVDDTHVPGDLAVQSLLLGCGSVVDTYRSGERLFAECAEIRSAHVGASRRTSK